MTFLIGIHKKYIKGTKSRAIVVDQSFFVCNLTHAVQDAIKAKSLKVHFRTRKLKAEDIYLVSLLCNQELIIDSKAEIVNMIITAFELRDEKYVENCVLLWRLEGRHAFIVILWMIPIFIGILLVPRSRAVSDFQPHKRTQNHAGEYLNFGLSLENRYPEPAMERL